jgi:hypothetical protein
MAYSPYVVRQGDHLRRLAATRGFDPEVVWGDASNAQLKALRVNYNVLLPGDILQLPDPVQTLIALEMGTTNTFTAPIAKPCTLTHTFLSDDDTPVANTGYTTIGAVDDQTPRATDANGTATFDVPIDADSVQIVFENGATYLLNVGHLDPAITPSGAGQRLINLGYLDVAGPLSDDDGSRADRDQCFRVALSAFQADNGLPSTGVLDDATGQKLAQVYGS